MYICIGKRGEILKPLNHLRRRVQRPRETIGTSPGVKRMRSVCERKAENTGYIYIYI